MSIQAMAWAIEHSGVKDPITKWVLVCLANYASADGSMAFPSVLRLANDTQLTERAVQKHLRKLEQLMLIRPGNRAFAMTKVGRADRLPKVYDIVIPRGEQGAPRSVTGCTERHHGVNESASRGEQGAPDPKRSVIEPKREEGGQAIPTGLPAKRVSEEERAEFKRQIKALASTPLTRRKREGH
jgi:hypothetical protein